MNDDVAQTSIVIIRLDATLEITGNYYAHCPYPLGPVVHGNQVIS